MAPSRTASRIQQYMEATQEENVQSQGEGILSSGDHEGAANIGNDKSSNALSLVLATVNGACDKGGEFPIFETK